MKWPVCEERVPAWILRKLAWQCLDKANRRRRVPTEVPAGKAGVTLCHDVEQITSAPACLRTPDTAREMASILMSLAEDGAYEP